MDSLPVNILDLGVIGFFIIGGLVGLAFGFVRGGLFIISWLGATVATVFGFPFLREFTRQFIDSALIADIVTGAAIFLVTLIILFLLSSVVGGWIRGSRLNALDRSLGMLAGLVVAAIMLSGGFIVVESVWPENQQPPWMREAKSLPLIKRGADLLGSILPGETGRRRPGGRNSAAAGERDAIKGNRALRNLLTPAATNSNAPDRDGYGKKQRKQLDRVIENIR